MTTVPIEAGRIHYEATGPETGRPVVFVHGYAMGPSLWRPLAERLATRGLRCLAPAWPLGAHPEPLLPGADRTLPGIAAMVDGFLAALELHDVVLVGNDTGGLIAQLVASAHPERLGALVLTSCDAFDNFPPPILTPFILASRLKVTFRAAMQPLRTAVARRRAYGALAHADLDHLTAEWVATALADPGVVEDLRRLTASLRRQTSLDAAARLGGFDRPTLVAWSADDSFFPLEHAHRLAELLPRAEAHVIPGARTFSMIDQPDRLADLVAAHAGAPAR